MYNPKLEIFVTENQIKFLILGEALGAEEISELENIYYEVGKTLTSTLGTLGEDFGEKILPGFRRVKWDINSNTGKKLITYKLGIITHEKWVSTAYYKLGLYFSFPSNTLKFEDYLGVIKAFSPLIAVEEFDPACVKESPLVIAKLTGSFSEFIERTQLSIRAVVNFIAALPIPSPVLTATGGAGDVVPLSALSAATKSAESEGVDPFEVHGKRVKDSERLETHRAAAAAPSPSFFLPPSPPLSPPLPEISAQIFLPGRRAKLQPATSVALDVLALPIHPH